MAEFIDIVLVPNRDEQLELYIQDDHGNEIPTNTFLDYARELEGYATERVIRIQHDDIEKL